MSELSVQKMSDGKISEESDKVGGACRKNE